MRGCSLLFLLLLAALAVACEGAGGGADPVDTSGGFDFMWPVDEGGTGDPDLGNAEVDVFEPQCVTAEDCVGKLDRPLARCERAACNDNLCGIVPKPNETPCDDNDECTIGDQCQDGLCVAGFNTCACRGDADCAARDDGNPCTGVLVCNTQAVPYVCEADPASIPVCSTALDSTCLKSQCDPADGLCKMSPANVGVACDDSDPCTSGTRCDAEGRCVGTDACDCRADADCAAFEDGNLCNGTLRCDRSGVPYTCRVNPATVIYCSSENNTACRQNRCNPSTGICVMTPMPDGARCEDGTQCTEDDRCQSGVCVPGPTKVCDDQNPCTNDGCNPETGNCTFFPVDGAPCEEAHECFVGNLCEDGICKRGAPRRCDDGDVCTVDECIANGNPYDDPCVHTFSVELCPPPE